MRRVDPFLESLGLNVLWQRRDADAAGEMTASAPDRIEAIESEPAPGNAAMPSVAAVASLDMEALRERVSACTACRLCESRTQTVFGVGDEGADWMVVGEGPGANEDEQGEPFVGQAGKLLDNMLRALGLDRHAVGRDGNGRFADGRDADGRFAGVFIANVIKCRPPNNRDPQADEVAACEAYLRQQIALVKPRIIVALGRFAAQTLLRSEAKIGTLRGTVHRFENVPVVVTYHPAYLLRSLNDKAKAWEDLCLARTTYRAACASDA